MLIVEIKVIPQSGRSNLTLDKTGSLKCFLKAAPEKGKANQEVIEIIAKITNLPKGAIEIIAGLTSRKKLIKLNTELSYEQFLNKIGAEIQKTIIS
ncbi:DUF167 domain-containing protein [Candidatus Dependentiae bacterium]|nr:DUF167 domain-containing protein [Candidatus Dependentiae bacterium]